MKVDKKYNPPKFSEVMAQLSLVKLPWKGEDWSIGDWGRKHRVNVVKTNRSKENKVEIFNTFVAALLQVARTRGRYAERIELMKEYFQNFSYITEIKTREMLRENKYPWISRAINVILESQRLVQVSSFEWEGYFQESEANFENGFENDKFLEINGAGPKGRDFALAQFSLYWCAIDRHLAHILDRTGLILHGFNGHGFGTNPSNRRNYKFMQQLVIQFSKETGWVPGSSEGWSPGAIDAALWLFGQGICKSNPECENCPIKNLCLAYRNKGY